MANLSKFESRENNKNFKFNFVKQEAVESNVSIVTKEKYEELYLELKRIKPFWDYEHREFVKVKKKITSIKLGINDNFRLQDGFIDRTALFTRRMLEADSLDEIVDYPFSFNYDNFFTMTNRIDVFSNVSKIQGKETIIDSLKGFSGNSLGQTNSAYGQNIKILKHFRKDNDTTYNYSDDIIPSFLYFNQEKQVIDKIQRSVNPVTREYTTSLTTKKKNVITGDVRYFDFKEVKFSPFVDRDKSDNFSSLNNKQNRYVFTDSTINNKILSNRNKDLAQQESNLFMPCGKSYDFSVSNGSGSFLSKEILD